MGPEDLPSLLAGSAEVVPAEELERKLTLGRPLRVKLGLDPTAPVVTLGWAVVLHKLRQFQDAGHTAVLIVGDFTAQVGDPSGKTETRPRLSQEEVRGYAERLLDQFWRILDPERTEVRYNAEWLEPMSMEEILRLSASTTVARMLERDDFAKRYAEGKPISIMEFLYPLLQGMDSVAVEADVELGGRDQTFNLLVGRDLQREFDQEPQVALTTPLLVGTDGVQKMSQSLGNYIGITDPPDEMFGKLARVPDELIPTYRLLALDFFRDPTEAERVEKGLEDGSLEAWDQKRRLAREVVDLYHGQGSGAGAEERFERVHRERELPEEVPNLAIPPDLVIDGRVYLPKLLAVLGLADSNSHARRLIEQGGVRLDGQPVDGDALELPANELKGRVLQVGRRGVARLGEREGGRPAPGLGPTDRPSTRQVGGCGSLLVPIDGDGPAPGRVPAKVVPGGWRSGPRDGSRLTPLVHVPTMMGRATPSLWSPFLRVGARTLRTEQCAKSQCVYPVEHGRCGSPCLSARRSYGNCNTGRPIRVCCSGRPTFQQRTRNRPPRPGPTVLLRRV